MTQFDLRIEGMSCSHCVASVKQAIESVPGVEKADVEVGRARVEANGSVPRDALRRAVEDAGFRVA